MSSSLKWMNPHSNELYHDRVREVEFRMKRLEQQRADYAQKYAANDPAFEWIYSSTFPAWLALDSLGAFAPEHNPMTNLELTFHVPTDDSYVYIVAGLQSIHQNTGLPNNSGVFQGAKFDLQLNGSLIREIYGIGSTWSTWQTKNYDAAHSIPPGDYAGAAEILKPYRVGAGDHTVRIVNASNSLYDANSTLWMKNRYIRVFVQA